MTRPLIDRLTEHLAPSLRIERELGGGGMSHVYVATDPSLERPVVVKVLPPERAAHLSAERFRREIAIAARLQHPNIVPVLAAGVADGLLWFSMPFVAGRSLRSRLAADGAIAPTTAIPILRDVARALAFAHRQGIVHRDVKPDNILLSEDGAATVTDFGIAKAIDTARTHDGDAHTLTQAGSSLGTPQYMAPEQIAGDPDVDGRADLYAFGIVAYEMLAGHTPFHGRPASQVLSAHLAEAPAPLGTVRPDIPASLAALVDRCLAKDPAARPATADLVVQALDAASTTGSVATRPRLASRPLRVAMVGAGVLVMAVATAWALRGRADAPTLDPSLVAVAPFRVVDPTGELQWMHEGMLDLLAVKLNGEGGVRATEPRAVLARWQALRASSGSGADAEPSRDEAQSLARAVGAAALLLGEVVPGAGGVELHATIVDAVSGVERHRVSVQGPRDSVVALAERLAVQVLTRLAGVGETRALPLSNVSLAALRPYLEGQALLRRLNAEAATAAYERALQADSTFALAGLGAVLSTSWYGAQDTRARALDIAWRHRDQLAPRDLALLEALAGPRYPSSSSTAELLAARETFMARAPETPDAWYHLGDLHFHYGDALGVADWRDVAERHFRRALEIDSGYVPGYAHLTELAVSLGDDALLERTMRLRLAHDTSQFTARTTAWHRAVRRGDSATAKVIEDSIVSAGIGYLFSFADYAMMDGYGLSSVLSLGERLVEVETRPATVRGQQRLLANMLHTAGSPTAAGAMQRQAAANGDPMLLAAMVRVGLVGDGDRRVADSAAAQLAALDDLPLVGADSVLVARREATRALAVWRLLRGDSSRTPRDLERLRAMQRHFQTARGTESAPGAVVDLHVEMIEALREGLRARRGGDSASYRRALAVVVQRAGELDWGNVNVERTMALTLLSARMLEEAGDLPGALRMAVKGAYRNGGELHPYYATQTRTVARLAARTGDVALARASWERLLQLRVRVEPALAPELAEARRALGR